jgi:hypothetical protein
MNKSAATTRYMVAYMPAGLRPAHWIVKDTSVRPFKIVARFSWSASNDAEARASELNATVVPMAHEGGI